jgi:lipoprotein-anchoring transpeptidase ErfK/SrfK
MTHQPAVAWSSPSEDATAWNRIPQWRYLEVVGPEESGRALTVDPRSGAYAYVDLAAVGAVGPPPENYFAAPPPDDETLALPGRIVGTVESYERPSRQDYFIADRLSHNDRVTVQGIVDRGEEGHWYRVGSTSYVPADTVRVPRLPDRTFPGRWIDANLNEPVLVTAYDGNVPVYSALAVKGTSAFRTPTGVFRVLRRVMSETMDSATIGIPRASPGGYYLRDVLFTQYFTSDGAALHYNYWRSNWGYAGSHGCMGMNYEDSQFFWNFASVGTVVYVHQ